MENQEKKHKRRVRYSGAYPKSYKEKYKELNPEKYADTVSRVIQKGSTPAGMHISICVNEILEFLQIKPGQTGLDATLGYGGHTQEMLKCLDSRGHLYALDVDPIESAKTKERLEKLGFGEDILSIRLQNFADIDRVSEEAGLFDFVLADLGVSSMQIDNPDRGFSYKTEGPLDLRMNPEKGISAAERLKNITQEELQGMLLENADEPYAGEISREAVSRLKRGKTEPQVIGERGVGLSGGQKQRISIARAIAKKNPILVLDDSTSALDMETEYAIQQALLELTETTKLIIAHRISAVRNADEIIVLENGSIKERGTHESLLSQKGLYYETWQAQYGVLGTGQERKEA